MSSQTRVDDAIQSYDDGDAHQRPARIKLDQTRWLQNKSRTLVMGSNLSESVACFYEAYSELLTRSASFSIWK